VSFYDKFYALCRERGTRPSPACTAMGLSKSIATRWKNGATPDGDTVLKICKYFDVPVSYFYDEEPETEKAASPAPVEADRDGDGYGDVVDLLTEMRDRPEMRMLFKLAKGATREDVEQAVKIIEALRK
jgi:transcriptional regulator with XRE-family HTH domain